MTNLGARILQQQRMDAAQAHETPALRPFERALVTPTRPKDVVEQTPVEQPRPTIEQKGDLVMASVTIPVVNVDSGNATVAIPVAAPVTPAIPTPISPNTPPKQDFLEKLGQWFREKFIPVAKTVEKDATTVAEVAEPIIDIAVPAVAGIYHSTLQTVIALEAIGGQGAGTQKMASAVAQLSPIVIPYLTQLGVANPTVQMVESYIQSVVDGLKILSVQTAAPAAPATQ